MNICFGTYHSLAKGSAIRVEIKNTVDEMHAPMRQPQRRGQDFALKRRTKGVT